METRKEIIKQMGDEMREDIFLEVNNRIERSLRRRFWLRISAVAASVTLLFSISNYISFHEGYKKLNSQMIEMVNPMGMRSSVVLSDGTKVILNAGTTLSYPAAFVSGQREVKVNGEAFFEVSHDKEHPFIVSTSKYQVKAVGTSFNVYDYQDSPQFEAALLNGKVEVTTNAKKSSAVILTPNQRAALCQGVLKVKPIENTNNYLWRKGILYFNEPLLEVFDKLQEYYDVEFQIRNTSLTRKSPYCTGKFRAKDGLEHIIRVLKETNHFDYQIDYENKKIIIL